MRKKVKKAKGKRRLKKLLDSIPPGYLLTGIYVSGVEITVTSLVNVHREVAYFQGEDCNICVFYIKDINGICFSAPAD